MKINIMAKTEYTKIVTKAGEAFYAHLREPETYEGKELGYSIQLKLNKEDTDELMSQIEAELEKAKSEMKLKPGRKWSKEPFMGFKTDKDGDIVFKFKVPSTIKTRSGEELPRTIGVFDATGNPIKGDNIGNGSTVKVAATLIPFHVSNAVNGVSLRLNAVQVLNLIEYGQGGSAKSYGFGEEDGYVCEENTVSADENEDNEELVEGDF